MEGLPEPGGGGHWKSGGVGWRQRPANSPRNSSWAHDGVERTVNAGAALRGNPRAAPNGQTLRKRWRKLKVPQPRRHSRIEMRHTGSGVLQGGMKV